MQKISVIIPVFNVEKHLEKCVKSVEAQTYPDYKIILVDDGSTDASGKICDALAEKNEKITVIHQNNRGLGGARNTGIRHCDTEYLLFLDSDDYIHPQLMERCIAAAEQNHCELVVFNMVSVYEDGKTGMVYDFPVTANTLLSKREINVISKNPTACDKLYKTSLFKDSGICFPEKVWYEDLKTVPKLILFAERVMKIESEPLYYYLQRSDSIMHTPDFDRVVKERIEAADGLIDFYKQRGKFEEYYDMLTFIVLYHAFLLPCLEMHRTPGNHQEHMRLLLHNLNRIVPNPLENPYVELLRRNEKIILTLALKKRFFAIRVMTALNRTVKKRNHH